MLSTSSQAFCSQSETPRQDLRPGQRSAWRAAPASATASESAWEDCPEPVLRMLAARGVGSPEELRRFFAPQLRDLHHPLLLLGMEAAVHRIQLAVAAAEPILIYGDYDVDGTTATVLLKTAIERIAPPEKPARVTYHVPHRLREGYGMQESRLALAAESGIRLVISVDTGIRAFRAAAEAKSLGLDLIVTDHHLPDGATGVPEAIAVINPAQAGCLYPNKNLCGAGVAFKLAHALLAAHAGEAGQPGQLADRLLVSFLKLVAIATIADSVELTGENRTMAVLGLGALANPVQPGLRALMQVAKLALDQPPTAAEVGFRIAPRINAAGRMDVASDVVELFLTRDPEQARLLAGKLDDLNESRRATEAEALAAIELELESLRLADGAHPAECLVLAHPAWHRGVLGILASRVVDRTGRPALVLCTDETGAAYGSGRSIPGYPLLQALTAAHAGELFTRFGGHAYAVGFTLPADRIGDLRRRMRQHAADHLSPDLLAPHLAVEAELTASELSLTLAHWLERCAPYGQGHPEPAFLVRGLRLCAPPRVIKERHICLQLAGEAATPPIEALAWARTGQATWAERVGLLGLAAGDVLDLVVRVRLNRYRNGSPIELEIIDLALQEASPASRAGNPELNLPLRLEAERVL